MTPTPERSPQSRLHLRGHAVRAGRFLWALLQMVIAMKVGMLIYHFKLDTVLAGTQFAALNVEYPVFGHWMMVAAMALAMSVFMRYYHKSTWQFCGGDDDLDARPGGGAHGTGSAFTRRAHTCAHCSSRGSTRSRRCSPICAWCSGHGIPTRDAWPRSVRTSRRREVIAMDKLTFSLCPACTACPEIVIEGDEVRIGEAENTAVLQKGEWNVLVDLIQSGQLTRI